MKQFKKGNWSNNGKCKICGTNKAGPVTLIPICGTENGGTAEAVQVHVDCIKLSLQTLTTGESLLFQRL